MRSRAALAGLGLAALLWPAAAAAQQAPAAAPEAPESVPDPGAPAESADEAAQRLGFSMSSGTPLVINSGELEVRPDAGGRRRVIFKGAVSAQQADMRLSCDWLEAAYPKSGKGQPERVVARGNVRIQQQANTARCREAVFDNLACTATCTGLSGSSRASLHRGDDVIEADEIFFDLCKGLVRARGGATVRVRGAAAQ